MVEMRSETVMASAARRRRRRFITAAVDAATGQIVDVFDGRDAADLRRWVSQQPRWWAHAVEVVCVDPTAPRVVAKVSAAVIQAECHQKRKRQSSNPNKSDFTAVDSHCDPCKKAGGSDCIHDD